MSAEVCARVVAVLPSAVDSPSAAGIAAHLEQCLSCRAELARYRKTLRLLSALRADLDAAPPGGLADVLGAIGRYGERRAIVSMLAGRRIAYGVGLVVAVVALSGALGFAATKRLHSATR